jgi:cytochrome c oxidase cbb3-type subunit 3
MRQTILVSAAALIAACIGIAQGPATPPAAQTKGAAKGQNKGQAKAAPRDPTQSPASQPGPPTVTPQVYPAEQVQAGELKFTSQCGFCHGRDAAGGETGPDLTRSELVAGDTRGDKIGPLVRKGRAEQGMPSFARSDALSDADLGAIVAFIHSQKTKFEALGGGRRSVDATDLATGDAEAGRRYFSGAGGCFGCHSGTGDLAHIATRYQGLALLQRMLYPTAGRPAPARPKVTLTLASGQAVVGSLASEDEFSLVVLGADGVRQTYEKRAVRFKIDDPMSAHFDQLGKYTDKDMHNVFAYLDTLK